MKKLILLCLVLIFSGNFYAQDAVSKSPNTTKQIVKKKSGYDYNKDVDVKRPVKKTAIQTEIKTKSSATKIATKTETTSKTKVAKARKLKESNEKAPKTPDKITGEYNGKKVYTGSRGGKYYINKNGNKTYIQD